MKLKLSKSAIALVVPVASLRTEKSCGIGEFLDLPVLAKFCKKAKIAMVQILPVNDSGLDSSPYNLVSAFALNPCYISLERLEGAKPFLPAIKALREQTDGEKRFLYRDVLTEKLKIARNIFAMQKDAFTAELADTESNLSCWVAKNTWLKAYAVYKNIKEQNFQSPWYSWTSLRVPTKAELQTAWDCPALKSSYYFYIWMQYNLHIQLLEAVHAFEKEGIMLKGDLPIMLNKDSCDVWSNHELFRSDVTAGAPPDGENKTGQNWGFPCYFWQNHKEDGYQWWKERLVKSDQYYNAFRLDHILGFFRIWAIPKGETTACLGRTVPYTTVSTADLQALGFSDGRIRWMSEPHITTESVMAINNGDYLNSHGELHKVADRIGDEELWLFKHDIKNETDITARGLKPACENFFRQKWLDRMLIRLREKSGNGDVYTIAWNFQDTTAWRSFSESEKRVFLDLQKKQNEKSEHIWKKHGYEILKSLCESVKMQAFAEDLGAIPACVPEVLEELNIFSLKVIRWCREWDSPKKNFIPLRNYKPLSLTTPSIHDSSTLAGWWNNELSFEERRDLLKALNVKDTGFAPLAMNEDIAETLLKAIAKSPSHVVAFQIQDLLEMIARKLKIEGDQRINIPGTVSDFNWTYRMPIQIEKLSENKSFIEKVKGLGNKQ